MSNMTIIALCVTVVNSSNHTCNNLPMIVAGGGYTGCGAAAAAGDGGDGGGSCSCSCSRGVVSGSGSNERVSGSGFRC